MCQSGCSTPVDLIKFERIQLILSKRVCLGPEFGLTAEVGESTSEIPFFRRSIAHVHGANPSGIVIFIDLVEVVLLLAHVSSKVYFPLQYFKVGVRV